AGARQRASTTGAFECRVLVDAVSFGARFQNLKRCIALIATHQHCDSVRKRLHANAAVGRIAQHGGNVRSRERRDRQLGVVDLRKFAKLDEVVSVHQTRSVSGRQLLTRRLISSRPLSSPFKTARVSSETSSSEQKRNPMSCPVLSSPM